MTAFLLVLRFQDVACAGRALIRVQVENHGSVVVDLEEEFVGSFLTLFVGQTRTFAGKRIAGYKNLAGALFIGDAARLKANGDALLLKRALESSESITRW